MSELVSEGYAPACGAIEAAVSLVTGYLRADRVRRLQNPDTDFPRPGV